MLDVVTTGSDQRLIGNNNIDTDWGRLVGFENHSGLTELGPGARPLGRTVAGRGNNGQDQTEGAVRDNVFGTYLHGPVLAKSPRFADELLSRALARRGAGRRTRTAGRQPRPGGRGRGDPAPPMRVPAVSRPPGAAPWPAGWRRGRLAAGAGRLPARRYRRHPGRFHAGRSPAAPRPGRPASAAPAASRPAPRPAPLGPRRAPPAPASRRWREAARTSAPPASPTSKVTGSAG